jgi:hypothetical protein
MGAIMAKAARKSVTEKLKGLKAKVRREKPQNDAASAKLAGVPLHALNPDQPLTAADLIGLRAEFDAKLARGLHDLANRMQGALAGDRKRIDRADNPRNPAPLHGSVDALPRPY